MSRRVSIVGVVCAISLVAVASAIAGGSLSSASKSGTAVGQKAKTLTPKCAHHTGAVSAGFDGALTGNPSSASSFKFTFPRQLRLLSAKAKVGFTNATLNDAKVRGIVYCGTPKVTEAKNTVSVDAETVKSITAKCPNGREAISGGFSTKLSVESGGGATGSAPVESYRSAKTKWTVTVFTGESGHTPATVYVYCTKGKALTARSKKVTLQPVMGNLKTTKVDASCKKGERVVSGGYRSTKPPSPNAFAIDSYRKATGIWHVGAITSSTASKFTAFAYCRKK